ncbi:hypothetical protein HGA88_00685 [Candidatus Roizmanbacteria bacterium]|nr:hypothetical protein [Candidatus Roizmanbacteria bacterium]
MDKKKRVGSIIIVVGLLVGVVGMVVLNTFYTKSRFGYKSRAADSVSTYNILDYGAKKDGVADDSQALQTVIDIASKVNGGTVLIPAGNYVFSKSVILRSNVTIQGSGVGKTIIKCDRKFSYVFANNEDRSAELTTDSIDNVEINDLTIDTNFFESNSGIALEKASNVRVHNIEIKNIYKGWGIRIGSMKHSKDSVAHNNNIVIENSTFDGHHSSLEQILVFNSSNVTLRNNTFKNIVYDSSLAGTSSIGIYQNANTVVVERNTFGEQNKTGTNLGLRAIYYSLSCDNVTISNNNIYGSDSVDVKDNTTGHKTVGVQGANLSDNGNFGRVSVLNYKIQNNSFNNLGTGLQLGAVEGGIVTSNTFNSNVVGLLISDDVWHQSSTPSSDLFISKNTFTNNNSTNIYSILHPGILLVPRNGITSKYINITGNTFRDTRTANQTQLYPITFDGGTWNNIAITNNSLKSYSPGESIALASSATLGTNTVVIYENTDYSGSISQQSKATNVKGIISTTSTLPFTFYVYHSSNSSSPIAIIDSTTSGQFAANLFPGTFKIAKSGFYAYEKGSSNTTSNAVSFTISYGNQLSKDISFAVASSPTFTPTPTIIKTPTVIANPTIVIPPTIILPTATPTPRVTSLPTPTAILIPTQKPGTPIPTKSPTPLPTKITISTTPKSCPLQSQGDVNCDGKIDLIDFEIWRESFFR